MVSGVIFQTDLAGLCHWVSSELTEMTGLNPSELRGQFWLKLVHPDERTELMNRWDDAAARRAPFEATFKLAQRETLVRLITAPAWQGSKGIDLITAFLSSVEEAPSADEQVGLLRNQLQLLEETLEKAKAEALKLFEEKEQRFTEERNRFARELETQQALMQALREENVSSGRGDERRQELERALAAREEEIQRLKSQSASEREALILTHARAIEDEVTQATERAQAALQVSEKRRVDADEECARLRTQIVRLEAELNSVRSEHAAYGTLVGELRASQQALQQELRRTTTENLEVGELRQQLEALKRTNGELSSLLTLEHTRHQEAITQLQQTYQESLGQELAMARERIRQLEHTVAALQDATTRRATAVAQVREQDEERIDTGAYEQPLPAEATEEEVPVDRVLRTVEGILDFEARQAGLPFESSVRDIDVTIPPVRANQFKALIHTVGELLLLQAGRSRVSLEAKPIGSTFCVRFFTDAPNAAIQQQVVDDGAQLGLRVVRIPVVDGVVVQVAPPQIPFTRDDAREGEIGSAQNETTSESAGGADETQVEEDPTPRILLAEDNVINQRLIGKILSDLGFQVDYASHGGDVFERMKHNRYCAVLMDCQMPIVDGYEATAGIRAQERRGALRTAVIGMSAHVESDSAERCRKAGMDGFLMKPIQREALEQALKVLPNFSHVPSSPGNG